MDTTRYLVRLTLAVNLETVGTSQALQAVERALQEHRKSVGGFVRQAVREGDVGLILEAERILLSQEQRNVSQTSEDFGSLEMAIGDLDAALEALAKLRDDPEAYKALDRDHSRPKNRRGDLPDDQARQFFRSHRTRLRNRMRGRATLSEAAVLEVRMKAMSEAERQYIAMQRAVLGIPGQAKSRSAADDIGAGG